VLKNAERRIINMNVSEKNNNYIIYLWAAFILIALLYFVITLKIEMPYDEWLSRHLTVSLAIINYMVFGISFIILAIPTRSIKLNYIACTTGLLSVQFFKISYYKAPGVNSAILLVSAVLFITVKYAYRHRQGESQ
jgi:hypothetical protein